MKRALHLFSNWRWTGPAEPALNLATALLRHGWDVTFACGKPMIGSDQPIVEQAQARGVPVRAGLNLSKHMNPFYNYPDGRALRRWLTEGRFDVLHCHLRNDHIVAALAARRMPGRPVVVRTCYAGEGPHGYWERRLVTEFTDGLIVVSEQARRWVVDKIGVSADRVWMLDTAVDLARFDPARGLGDRRAELGIAPNAFVVGIVARIQWRRRFDVFLEAVRLAHRQCPSLRALLVGRGTHMKDIAVRPVRKMGLREVAVIPGYQTGDAYVRTLASMDVKVYLVPGTDGSCRAAREAMAMGVPVVAARRGVLPELVAHAERGLVVDDTPENLAEAILQMARDPERRAAMGRSARHHALEHFSLERQAEAVGCIYQQLLERRRSGPR
jgi:glycosyltransferase involved in cell wall biosynthesis